MTPEEQVWLRKLQDLDRYALSLLGGRGRALLGSFGRLMDGPYGGSYVSALPSK